MRILKWISGTLALLILLGVAACSTVGLPRVQTAQPNTVASPDLLAALNGAPKINSVEEWENERAPYWKNLLLKEVYGSTPPALTVSVVQETLLADDLVDGKASLKAVTLMFGDDTDLTLDVHFVVPNSPGKHPVVLGAGFCPNHAALPYDGVVPPDGADYPGFCDGSWADPIFSFIFGRHISAPPLEDLIDRGYAFAAYYPAELVADSSEKAPAMLDAFPKGDMEHGPYSALSVWAWSASRILDYIETDETLDESKAVPFGHSRYGKSSLLAGVLDPRFAAVISHQSGTGGASLQKNDIGEPISSITENYPHWFAKGYADYAGNLDQMPFDQHALVALMAPRPLLLGNAARDQWSDPPGAFAAAQAASDVYELYGVDPFNAQNLKDFNAEAVLAYQFREGTHGITPEDWTPFLEWLDVQLAD